MRPIRRGRRDGNRLHASGAAESDGRILDDAPAGGVDLYRLPCLIAEVEIEPAGESADADMDLSFRSIEMRLGLNHVPHDDVIAGRSLPYETAAVSG